MSNLMSAVFFRLKRDRVFWCCFAGLFCLSAALMTVDVRQCRVMAAEGYTMDLAGALFQLSLAVEVCIAVFTGLYLGTDHGEGALRNRLMVGHSREQVYLAGLGAALTGTVAFTGSWLGGSGAVALLNREFWHMGAWQAASYILIAIVSAMALASILTMAGMLLEKKSTSAVVSILLVLGMLLAATWLFSRLQEPEMESGLIITATGMEWGTPTPNPLFVGGTLRQVFELLLDILPAGQVVLLSNMAVARPALNLAASAAVLLVTTLTGIALFRRKDLK